MNDEEPILDSGLDPFKYLLETKVVFGSIGG